jgi:acyl-coenzyme A synthetase/AMP-(fatty) acid ligase/aryl carrier-like protein
LLDQEQKLDLSRVRLVVLGGEESRSTDFEIFQKLFSEDAVFVNGLGPSESTLALQFFARPSSSLPGIVMPVGRGVSDTEIVLLDEHGDPTGITGELAIRSAYVTPGYWNAPDLTKVALSEQDESGRRLYRTGDHARFLADGQLLFTGRQDAQLKLRGHRIEAGEIESVILEHLSVEACVVILREDEPGSPQLIAYLTGADGNAPSVKDVRAHVRKKLPAYMVPAGMVCLDELPMTPNGKVDRRLLPVPDRNRQGTGDGELPVTNTQKNIAQIWRYLLKVDEVRLDDNFFDLGGHSLLTMQLAQKIRVAAGKQLSIADVFENPTVRELSPLLEDVAWNMEAVGMLGSGGFAGLSKFVSRLFRRG